MQNYPEELAALQEDYTALKELYTKAKQRIAELEGQQVSAVVDKHKVRVKLSTGEFQYFDGDTHKVLPSQLDPKLVEIRKTDKAKRTYSVVATIRWFDSLVVQNPSA